MIGRSHFGSLAAAVALMGIGAPIDEITRDIPRRQPLRTYDREPEMSRKQRRAADRSKKQYLLKGIRP